MSGWGMGWFGGGSSAQKKKDMPKNAILQLRQTMEMLNKRESHLQRQIEEQEGNARKYVNTNKNQAMTALRKKKTFETSLKQTQDQQMTLEREIASIETANINKETLEAMRNAGAAMKSIHKGITTDTVDTTMEELREQHAISEEINEALTSGTLQSHAVDEDELEDELNDLQQQELDNKVLDAGTMPVSDKVHKLPAAGNRPLPAQAQEDADEEEELKKLQAEMAM